RGREGARRRPRQGVGLRVDREPRYRAGACRARRAPGADARWYVGLPRRRLRHRQAAHRLPAGALMVPVYIWIVVHGDDGERSSEFFASTANEPPEGMLEFAVGSFQIV